MCCIFRDSGAELLGVLHRSGIGTAVSDIDPSSYEALWESMALSNHALFDELREDAHAQDLLSMTKEDARLGRMSWPVPVSDASQVDFLLNPRFAVEQPKPDGSVKLRAVDNFSWAAKWKVGDGACAARPSKKRLKVESVNGHTFPQEKLKHETLDELVVAMKQFWKCVGVPPALWKADIDSAFRRVPIKPAHRWACGIAFKVDGQVRPCKHC